MKKRLMSILILIVLILSLSGCRRTKYNIKIYNEIAESQTALPTLDELGTYKDVKFKYTKTNILFFLSDSYILRAEYDKENFEKEKEKVLNNYIFQKELDLDSKREIKKDPQFNLDGYDFRLLSLDDYDLSYPKKLIFIGVSDDKQEIAYVYYFDTDIDYIGGSFQDFLEEDCNW
jgi:lipoprotein